MKADLKLQLRMGRVLWFAWTGAIIACVLLASVATAFTAKAADAQVQRPQTSEGASARQAEDLRFFEKKAALSKELGATHMLVTEGLPPATWETDSADPYPMWFVHHASLLNIFPPKELESFVDAHYATQTRDILQQRCEVLGKYGLKGVWNANEPGVLPEAFFTAHPELRGPRIDQPNRSRKAYFAPNVDEPEVLRMYRDAMQRLLKTCPEVEEFHWVTTDAGSGFDWAPSLYPGINGSSDNKDRPLSDRVAGFLINAQNAARDVGHEVEINLVPIKPRPWMTPTFSPDVLENIVRKLPRGVAVEGREGPDGRRFAAVASKGSAGAFYPIVGIVVPSISGAAQEQHPGRLLINFGDRTTIDFNYRLLKFTQGMPMRTLSERVTGLRAFAATQAPEQQADNLVEVWNALNDVEHNLEVLNFGEMLRFGHVLNRWITRPMVPFPEELTTEETKYYRPFLFQAKGVDQAADLVDIQAMRPYEGWGARLLFQRTIEITVPRAQRALTLVQGIQTATKEESGRTQWEMLSKRLQALIYLLQSADDMVCYQAQLDRVKSLGVKPEADPVLGYQSSWARTDLMELARREIDTMVDLNRLLQSAREPILDLAPTASEETIMRLGPDTSTAIKHKIDVMNAHWRDYDRLFTMPNP
jgi:hypothetical protein